MTAPQDVLAALTRHELLGLAQLLNLSVAPRPKKDELLEAVGAAGNAAIRRALPALSRDRLKALCRKLALDDGGRDKASIAQRLIGRARRTGAIAQSKLPVRTPRAQQQARLVATRPLADGSPFLTPSRLLRRASSPMPDVVSTSPISLSELESHLWEAANILRGSPVDRTDWKSYILPLLFYKRVCDVWDEEHAAMLEQYGEDYADEHRFQVPGDSHWRVVRATAKNVGTALQRAMRSVEVANQKHLYGVFGDAQWSNKERLPDELLKDLLEHFSALSLGNRRVASDVIGDAYEYLIKQFADATNKKAGEFYTPRSVVRLIVDILDPKAGESIYDPACGTGGMLLAAVERASERGDDPRTFFGKLYGQEKNLTTASVARMNLFLHGIEDFAIERGDTLRNPIFTDPATGGLATFDVVIANPPFSLEQWGREVWESDPWGRPFAGLPSDGNADMAWVQHMVKSMAPRAGRMAVVLPQGALFRGGIEGQIRQHMLEHDLVEAVIGLAPNLFYGTGLAACIMVLRQSKLTARKKKVLIIDASSVFRKGRAQNFVDPEHGQQILRWVRDFANVEDRARVVSLAEIEKEGFTLNISHYVLPPIGLDIPPLPEAVAAFKNSLQRCREAEDNLRGVMQNGGWLW